MAQRVFLHVGTPKSGTSYLHDVLWRNAAALRQQGLLLPANLDLHHTAARRITGRRGYQQQRGRHEVAWRTLVREIRAGPDRALVSHELLAPATREQARTAIARLAPAEVHLIVTVRALHRQLSVSWQEQVKGGHWLRYTDFLEQVRTGTGGRGEWFWSVQDVLGIIARWGADLPPDRVHVVTCPPTADDPELLWRRYASVLGVDEGTYDLAFTPGSRSLGVVETEVLRRVQSARDYRFRDQRRHVWTRRLLSTRLLSQRDGEPIRLPEDCRPWIEHRTDVMTEGLRAGGYDIVGDLGDLAWRAPTVAARLTRDVTPDEVAQVSAWTIGRLQEELVQRQPRTPYPDVGPEDGEAGILELLEHIRAADVGAEPREPATRPQRSGLRSLASRLRR